jgi:hypothetical protein
VAASVGKRLLEAHIDHWGEIVEQSFAGSTKYSFWKVMANVFGREDELFDGKY